MKNKKCQRCGKYKKTKMFNKDCSSLDGYTNWCKKCVSIYKKQYYKLNKTEIKLKSKQRQKKKKKQIKKQKQEHYQRNKKSIDKKNNEWKKKNLKRHKRNQQKYRDAHKKERALYDKKRKKTHKEDIKTCQRKRRAAKLLVKENYTYEDKKITLNAFNHKCENCGKKNKLSIDHHRPLSKGNPLTLSNAVPLCHSCNSSKGNKKPEEFYGIKKCKRLDKKLKKIAAKNKIKD